MAELVDAEDLKSSGANYFVPVRFRLPANFWTGCEKTLAFLPKNCIICLVCIFLLHLKNIVCDLLFGECEISTPMKEWFLSTKKSFGLLIFWIKQKNKSIMEPSGLEKLWNMIFQVLEDIRE
jgi:hypothetical protein